MKSIIDAIQADKVRRQNALAEILDGLGGEDDWYWRGKAESRIRALEEDGVMFGLVPHEAQELAALKRALGRQSA